MGAKGFLLGGALGSLIENLYIQDQNTQKAEQISIKAMNKMSAAQKEESIKRDAAQNAILRLANRKNGILQTSINDFIKVYETISQIRYKNTNKDTNILAFSLNPIVFDEYKRQVNTAFEPMTSTQLVGAYIVKGGVSGIMVKESENQLAEARIFKKKAEVTVSQTENICLVLGDVKRRADKVVDILSRLNVLLIISINESSAIIEKNGINGDKYNQSEADCLQTCINTAFTIKTMIDAPLIDEDGELSNKIANALAVGESYIQSQMNI